MTRRSLSRADVVRLRFRAHGLAREPGHTGDLALLDAGVQDTGPDGALWALVLRGADPAIADELVYAWTFRGAPHAYRRSDRARVATATAPLSEADAAKRVFDAATPLRAAGIPILAALADVARQMRDIVTEPMVKGELSTRLSAVMGAPFVRRCRPCNATHLFEMPFRLAALQAGLELVPSTSPPVLRRIPRLRPPCFSHLGGEADARFDVVRNHLRFYPGAGVQDVATYLDAPVRDVRAAWPDDAVEVTVTGAELGGTGRSVLDGEPEGGDGAERPGVVRLLGPFDPYLQLRDREVLVADGARRKDLWRTLGRPGAVVRDGEVVGTWRPRTAKGRLSVVVDRWGRWDRALRDRLDDQAERLAAHRGVALAAVVDA